ncbi:putative spermidine/putrescine transport system ATP-binding protein [Palleronia aestuarii]|uniref:Putative spermidine/putrescine transport system ATP-binding protein n=1 Tax=Palleronia aestuarii TaxID=568105 RepID=A0A2W7NHY3_9RHOB|nr:ABC transporter ATP-binding protein [Palleronia aestuarii]PZX19868.1 putative spermidine/putrescine transport system ATP-binding protein [Palleronia aestuarii]
MARLQLEGLSKRYNEFYAARDIHLDVAEGEMLVLLGPSGCGKTTTLRMIAGFVEPSEGVIRIGGEDVTWHPPWKRSTGLVFQNYALFPHLTVARNLAFGLEMRRVEKSEIDRRVHDALAMVRLDHLADRLPRQLSGGQQQRVALARALVVRPDVLLLDEPLSNLDAKLREEVRIEIRALQQRLGITTVMVTHDQEEALSMADRLVVMKEGEVRQIGSQQELYERPVDRFVASFVGRSSFLRGRLADGILRTEGGLEVRCSDGPNGPAAVAIRPERVTVAREAPSAENVFPGEVEHVSYLGGSIDVRVRLSPKDVVVAQMPNVEGGWLPQAGDRVHAGWSASAKAFADTETEEGTAQVS